MLYGPGAGTYSRPSQTYVRTEKMCEEEGAAERNRCVLTTLSLSLLHCFRWRTVKPSLGKE